VAYKIVIYCPDRHILYDGRTPEEVGVGGGITARVRMAHALQRMGHAVSMVVNCRKPIEFRGVEYIPLTQATRLEGDVVILNTSGGDLDISPSFDLKISARLRILWVHGTPKPHGLGELQVDRFYAVSNFIRDVIHHEWGVPGERIFVSYNAYDKPQFLEAEQHMAERDPFQCVYFSHPSKGLDAARKLVAHLRDRNSRFHLEIFGGRNLWGEGPSDIPVAKGEKFYGLIGQKALLGHLLRSGFSIQLQEREEPGALAIIEAMRAGTIVIGSRVGCYPEYIRDGHDGLLFDGALGDPGFIEVVAERMYELLRDPQAVAQIRRHAQEIPWDSETMSRVWTSHWERILDGEPTGEIPCPACAAPALVLDDGRHCETCGRYSREWVMEQTGSGRSHGVRG